MVEAIASFIEFLFERSEGSWRTNGAILVALIVATATFFATRRQAAKWRHMKEGQRATMLEKPLVAEAITTEKRGEVAYAATIELAGERFRLLVVRAVEPDTDVVIDHSVGSLDEMENFLRANTQFILADFN